MTKIGRPKKKPEEKFIIKTISFDPVILKLAQECAKIRKPRGGKARGELSAYINEAILNFKSGGKKC